MPAHLDAPSAAAAIDPLCFIVRGWIWLDAAQRDVVAIEARTGDAIVGHTTALYARPDVTAALTLPAGARVGFELFAHHATATPGQPVTLVVEARLRDGTHAPVGTAKVNTIARDYRQNDFGI